MATDTIKAEKRELFGSQNAKRLRASGMTPAVVYGHGKETVSICIPTDKMMAALRHHAHLIQFEGAVTAAALLKEVQWDAMGTDLLHIDFTRVDKDESTEVAISLELRGVAPGTKMGGTVDLLMRDLEIICPVVSIPDVLEVNINDLELDGTITAKEIELPKGAKLVGDADQAIATCVVHADLEDEETEGGATGAEPEVIGGTGEDGEGESGS